MKYGSSNCCLIGNFKTKPKGKVQVNYALDKIRFETNLKKKAQRKCQQTALCSLLNACNSQQVLAMTAGQAVCNA